MKKNILLRTNILICLIIAVGFLLTAVLSYRVNYSASLINIEQISTLSSEGIYYQMTDTFTKPVNVSLTMAHDSLLMEYLSREQAQGDDPGYLSSIQEYLDAYRRKFGFDSVFLVSASTARYYSFHGLDRVLTEDNPENEWYYELLDSTEEYSLKVDNDEVADAGNRITVFVNCKIKDANGKVLGIVGVGLRIDSLQRTLQSYRDEFGVNACLINSAGVIEISSEYTGYKEVNFFDVDSYDDTIRQQILSWKEGEMAGSFWAVDAISGRQDHYLVARYLPELDWHLVVELDASAMLRRLHWQMAGTIAIIIANIALILIVITRLIRQFNRQIVALTRSVEQERRTMFEQATQQLFENIYELDITHNRPANKETADYFESLGTPPGTPYDKALRLVARKQVKEEFREGYIDTFAPENVLRAFEEGLESLRHDFMISTGGDYYWMRITARIIRWESDGSIHMLTYRQNIDAEKQQERRMFRLSQTDEMTGMLTKTATRKRVQELLAEYPERQYAFFIFDIDWFKQANDRFGHAFGDGVIRAFTKEIRLHFTEDDVLGRVGGDEFVAFTAIPEEQCARDKGKSLSAALDQEYRCDEKVWHISASIGAALSPKDGKDFDNLYKNSDAALYETKKRGKNGFTLYGEPDVKG